MQLPQISHKKANKSKTFAIKQFFPDNTNQKRLTQIFSEKNSSILGKKQFFATKLNEKSRSQYLATRTEKLLKKSKLHENQFGKFVLHDIKCIQLSKLSE